MTETESTITREFNLPHVWDHDPVYWFAQSSARDAIVNLLEKVGRPTSGKIVIEVTARWEE